MASVLAKKNFKVTILEWDRSSNLPSNQTTNNVTVRRMKLKAPYGFKLFFMLPIWYFYVSFFVLSRNFDAVQPQNLDNLLAVAALRKTKKFKIVYDIADFYADCYVPVSLTLLRATVAWLEKALIRTVDSAIIVDESRLDQIGLFGVRFSVIYNSPPDLHLTSSKTSDCESCFRIFYAGILEKDRGLTSIVEAVQNLSGVHISIAGFGRLEKEFAGFVKGKLGVKFLGQVPYDEVLRLTFSSDCIIALYDPAIPNNMYASPNKLFEAMAYGKPIIVSDCTAMADIVRREKCGFVVKYGDIKQLRDLILSIKDDPGLLASYGFNGRQAYERRYSWSLMEVRLLTAYNALLASGA
jgi:glycosyltransferase involved in cell wall biosynthesis